MSAATLANQLLVNATDVDDRGLGALERDALDGIDDDRMREAKRHLELAALECGTIANADELERLGIALGSRQ